MTRMPSSGRVFVMACSLAATSRVRLPLAAVAGWIGHVNATSGDDREGPTSNSGTDFIREMLKQHSSSGPYGGRVQTVSHRSRTAFCTLGTPSRSASTSVWPTSSAARRCCASTTRTPRPRTSGSSRRSRGCALARLRAGTGRLCVRLFRSAPFLGGRIDRKGPAYVDDQDAETISENQGGFTTPGVDSPWRDRSVEENLDLFARMTAGEFDEGSVCCGRRST